jgi:ABC-type branched-subunit amino acid transport system ATPase component
VSTDGVLLEARGLTLHFGGVRAVHAVDFQMREGNLQCLIGPNGAGKTTFFNLLTGRLRPQAGTISFRGEDITVRRPHERVRLGIARTFQITNLFQRLPVFENVRLAAQRKRETWNILTRREDLPGVNRRASEALEWVGLVDKGALPASALSHGERKKLELAMARAADPELLLLDEPTAGLNDAETAEVARLLKAASRHISLLVIEHDIAFVREIAERITVLNRGEILAEGTVGEIEANPVVRQVYLAGAEAIV